MQLHCLHMTHYIFGKALRNSLICLWLFLITQTIFLYLQKSSRCGLFDINHHNSLQPNFHDTEICQL